MCQNALGSPNTEKKRLQGILKLRILGSLKLRFKLEMLYLSQNQMRKMKFLKLRFSLLSRSLWQECIPLMMKFSKISRCLLRKSLNILNLVQADRRIKSMFGDFCSIK